MITALNINDDSVTGRLGNKLFLVAAMIGLAERYDDKLILPEWEYKNIFPNIPTAKAEHLKVNVTYREPHFHYKQIPFRKGYSMHLQGYYQSEKYFDHCRDAVKHYFSPNAEIVKEVDEKWSEIQNIVKTDKTVLVQVRAGWGFANDYHGILPMEYFEEAFKKFPKHKFIMFSDEIEKCKQDFNRHDIHFVDNTNPVVDLFLSARCKHAIIPNSSFSWWSAWFMDNPQKQVIAPKAWFGPRGRAVNNTKDLYMKDWTIL
jgi:hypothetical protein